MVDFVVIAGSSLLAALLTAIVCILNAACISPASGGGDDLRPDLLPLRRRWRGLRLRRRRIVSFGT
jgi:hypothetical protein